MSEKTDLTTTDLYGPFRHLSRKQLPSSAMGKVSIAGLLWLGIFIASSWATSASAQQFIIEKAGTELVDQVYILNANLKYSFSDEALEALESGVSLILVLDIEVIKPRRYMWDEDIAALKQSYELKYLALADQYQLGNRNSGAQHVYHSLNEALATLERIENLPLIDSHLLKQNERYKVQVRSRLDIDSLPVPLRLSAYFSGGWWLTSGWYSWDL